jgi:hypothetical protein
VTDDELAHALSYYQEPGAWRAAENRRILSGTLMDDEAGDGFQALMSDSPVSGMHGRSRGHLTYRTANDRDGEIAPHEWKSLSSDSLEGRAFVRQGGAEVVHAQDLTYHGSHAHRGTLSDDERLGLDERQVRTQALALLEVTEDELAITYGPGRPSSEVVALRSEIDARLLAIQEDGGNMVQLAGILGWSVSTTQTGQLCRTMTKSLRRARQAREERR